MQSLYDTMAVMYVDYYNKNGEKKTYDFVFNTKVALSILNSLYEKFMIKVDGEEQIPDIGSLPKEKKQKYWDIAGDYFENIQDRIKATKAIYTLDLITSNN